MTTFNLSPSSVFDWIISSSLYIPGKPLFFTDVFFVVFLFLFLLAYTFAATNPRRRIAVILFFSLWFYYKSAGIYILVILFTAGFSYFTGIAIERAKTKHHRTWLAISGITVNIAMLAFFKYTPFYIRLSEIFTTFNFEIGAIAFPIGLSFYTFCNLSYILDIKKRVIAAEPSFVTYLSYITFFPTVQMGPIERAGNIIPQLKRQFQLSREDVGEGFLLILSGAIKKMVIGDFINHQLVMNIFSAPERYTGMENLAAALGYSLVIYCDFSGYTDIARGLARWMGFRISLNFNFPYKAWNIGEFWRRWHISLSSWLRDYLFMPVAFRLSSAVKREYLVSGKFIRTDLIIFTVAAMITFTICGIWHGAGINFLIWGMMHGAALSVQKIWSVTTRKFRQNRTSTSRKFHRFVGIILTFSFVSGSWVFFRMRTPEESLTVFSQIVGNFGFSAFPAFIASYYPSMIMLTLGYLFHFAPEKIWKNLKMQIQLLAVPVKLFIAIVMILLIVYFQSLGSAMPIYIQF